MFLSARAISQAYLTRQFLENIRQVKKMVMSVFLDSTYYIFVLVTVTYCIYLRCLTLKVIMLWILTSSHVFFLE